ncbi:MAG: hypothetical protein K6D97_08940 [Clostridia bacterium]|nr:hypothetical protein [Clostridia bacterium]
MKRETLATVTHKHTHVDSFKRSIIFFLLSFFLLIMNLLISTTSYNSWNLSLQIPIQSVYGNISYLITIIFGISGTLFIKIADIKKIGFEKVFLCLAIPIGLLYCFTNPLGKVPDEDFHARKVMAIASRKRFF